MIARPEIAGTRRVLPNGREAIALRATHKLVAYAYARSPGREAGSVTVSTWRDLPPPQAARPETLKTASQGAKDDQNALLEYFAEREACAQIAENTAAGRDAEAITEAGMRMEK